MERSAIRESPRSKVPDFASLHPGYGLAFFHVIPGRANGFAQSAAGWREPGIHNHDWGLWIPGLRQVAHPGMTKVDWWDA
jgi:hypothetical protein